MCCYRKQKPSYHAVLCCRFKEQTIDQNIRICRENKNIALLENALSWQKTHTEAEPTKITEWNVCMSLCVCVWRETQSRGSCFPLIWEFLGFNPWQLNIFASNYPWRHYRKKDLQCEVGSLYVLPLKDYLNKPVHQHNPVLAPTRGCSA